MADEHPTARAPGDRAIAAGVVLFSLGLLAIVVIVLAFLLGSDNAPLPLTVLALLMPLGLGSALLGLLRRARR